MAISLFPRFLSPSPSTSQSSSSSLPNSQPWKLKQTKLNAQTPLASIPRESPCEECSETEAPPGDLQKKESKKKKRLRPSFYEQTIRRWSVKISSQRSKFPWQVREAEEEEERNQTSLPALFTLPPPVEDSPSRTQQRFGFPLDNHAAVSAPWAHGGGSSRARFNSEDRTLSRFKNCDFVRECEKSGVVSIVEKLDNRSFDQNRSPLDSGVTFADSDDDDEEPHPCLPSDNPVQLHVRNHKVPASLTHLESETSTRILSKSLQTNGGFEKSKVGSIIDKLKSCSDQNSSSLNANSDDEHGSESGGSITNLMGSVSFPWEREGDHGDKGHLQKRSNTKLAESMIPEPELRRLRNAALRMKERTKVGSAGVTEALVNSIHEKWKGVEVVKLKFEGPSAINMKRMHELLQRKTGGLVIWRSGSSLVLYRGMNYKLPCVQSYSKYADSEHSLVLPSQDSTTNVIRRTEINGSVKVSKRTSAYLQSSFEDTSDGLLDTLEIDSLLDELGPRFRDWSGRQPLPVDADLLPCVVPGYKTPFRLLPYKTKHALRNREMTHLRQLARTMPPHFALGRNRQHQGLAQAMLKLWERSCIAKIAIKRGVPNTCNERMAEELKKLTGGTLVSRNKDYIVIFRGNDFLTPPVTEVLVERQKLATVQQDEEEQARLRASDIFISNAKIPKGYFVAGTLAETEEAKTRWGNQRSGENLERMMRDLDLSKHASLIRYLEKKLALAQLKVRKAERALQKVQEFLEPAELPTDLETVTDEERFLFRKIGLKMTAFLSMGRRGVFDGTVENMHLNWKHRELVKIIVKGKSFAQVKHIAISLEAESGGVLISLDKTTKGYAIIIYRGKNYHRPYILRPKNLLTRRQALARSIELQRREALIHHISNLGQRIEMLKSELDQRESVQDMSNKDMYSMLHVDFSSDEEVEDEGEEAYLETFNCNVESGDDDSSVRDA